MDRLRRAVAFGWMLAGLAGATQDEPPFSFPRITVRDFGGVGRERFPVSGAVPFPRRSLAAEDVRRLSLLDGKGQPVPVQFRVNGRWPDGSVRWLHLDFQSTQPAGSAKTYGLRLLDEAAVRREALARKTADGVTVDTGSLRAEFRSDRCLIRVRRGGRWVTAVDGPVRSHLRMTDPSGEAADVTLGLGGAEIEENGPERSTLIVAGPHRSAAGRAFSPSEVRLTFARDAAFVSVQHTWVLSEDPHQVAVARIGLDVPLSFAPREAHTSDGALTLGDRPVGVYQERNLVEPSYPPRRSEFDTAYEVFEGDRVTSRGKRYGGAFVLRGPEAACGVYVRHFWEMAPKRVRFDPREKVLSVDFWPGDRAGALDLRRTEEKKPRHYQDFTARDPLFRDPKYSPSKYVPYTLENSALGISRTHEVVFDFGEPASPAALAALFASPLVPFAGAEWNVRSGVTGKQSLPVGPGADLQRAAEAVGERLLREVEESGWYGETVYGNVRYLYDEGGRGWMPYHPKFAWFNSEHLMFVGGNLLNVLWQLYLRTGDPRYYRFAQARAEFRRDVSVLHHGPAGFHFVRHGGYDPWVGARHTNGEHAAVCGLDLHYYVTGCLRTRGVLDRVRDVQYRHVQLNHGRGMATDLDSMMRHYLLTLDRKYYDRCLTYLAHYEDTMDTLKSYHGYWQYRVTALQHFHEFCDDPAARERVRKVFLPNWGNVPKENPAFRLTDAAFVYELAPEHAEYLRRSLPASLPASVDAVRWGGEDFPQTIHMNEIALVGALWYAGYWAERAKR